MKKGAIHVDWVISMGLFLVYLIVLLVLIKPSYKANYEGDVLTKMIKDEFLKQNKVDAGFVVFKAENCNQVDSGVNVIQKLSEKSGANNLYITGLQDPNYKAYFLEGENLNNPDLDLGRCENVEVGEVVYYNGLKSGLKFEIEDFSFPSSRNYEISVGGSVVRSIGGKPTSDAKVYVLDWSSAKLKWDAANEEIIRENVIINIRVW